MFFNNLNEGKMKKDKYLKKRMNTQNSTFESLYLSDAKYIILVKSLKRKWLPRIHEQNKYKSYLGNFTKITVFRKNNNL